MKIYNEFAEEWYQLFTPLEGYKEEAEIFHNIFGEKSNSRTMLELGCGSGHNAYYLKQWYKMTLSDLSENILSISRKINPECEHIQGDMRTLRLNREFDFVFIHDAIMYMLSENDLRKALETAFIHLKAGGKALIVPDFVKETFAEETDHGGSDGKDKLLRYLEWTSDPNPDDTTCTVDYVYVMKNADGEVTTEHDRHIHGLFSKKTWIKLIHDVGFNHPEMITDKFGRILFLCEKA